MMRRFFWRPCQAGVAASLLALLTACTTLPAPNAPPSAPVAPLASEALPAAEPVAAPPASAAPRASRISDFISRHLLRRAEKPAPAPVAEAVPVPETPVDEKYRLTGEDALELERGQASWYGSQFHGRRTASGENYDKYALTAAHKTLPFGTIVRVRSLKLGREVDVRINDRGPFSAGRVIDVSEAAAEALGLVGAGVAEVSLNVGGTLDGTLSAPTRGRKIHQAVRKPGKSGKSGKSGKAPSARRRR